MKGRFYGIGVGPGDPELLTLKGHRLLTQAAVLCYPETAAERGSIALSIVSQLVQGEKEHLPLAFPMTRNRESLEAAWREAAGRVLTRVHQGQDVAFITLGDPAFYSTYGYLVRRLREMDPEVQVETVPGVTAFSAGAAALNLALGEGKEKVAIVPSVEDPAALPEILRTFEGVILMKVHRNFSRVVDLITEEGRKGDAFFVSRLGHPGGFIEGDLDRLRGQELDYLSMIILRRREQDVGRGQGEGFPGWGEGN